MTPAPDNQDGAEQSPARDPRPVGEIVSDLWVKAESLIRQELQLGLADAQERVDTLKRELLDQVARLRTEVTLQLIAGLVLFTGLLALGSAVILLLARVVSPWIAALIVGVAITAAGVALLYRSTQAPSPLQTRGALPPRPMHDSHNS